MSTYLEDHPPARSQYRRPRRSAPTGAIVLHDAENATDLDGPDTGAETVARFIATRSDPGSYHSIVDSDSTVPLIPYAWEAYHEGTGGNPWSLGLSFAYSSKRPPTPTWWDGALLRGAHEADRMAAWVRTEVGVTVPARRITAAQYRAGHPGFIAHADLDPGRRTDPVGFPWARFLALFADLTDQAHEETTMTPLPAGHPGARIQRAINANGLQPQLKIDGDPGKTTADGLDAVLTYLNGENKRLTDALAVAEATSAAPRLAQLATDLRAALTRAGL